MARDDRVRMWAEQRSDMWEKAWEIRQGVYGKKRDADRLAKEEEARELERNAEILTRYIRAAAPEWA